MSNKVESSKSNKSEYSYKCHLVIHLHDVIGQDALDLRAPIILPCKCIRI